MLCALLSSCRHLVASKIEKGEKCHDNTGYNTVTLWLYFGIIRNFLTLNKTNFHKQEPPRKLFFSTSSFSKHLCFCVLILLVDLHLMLLGVLLFSARGLNKTVGSFLFMVKTLLFSHLNPPFPFLELTALALHLETFQVSGRRLSYTNADLPVATRMSVYVTEHRNRNPTTDTHSSLRKILQVSPKSVTMSVLMTVPVLSLGNFFGGLGSQLIYPLVPHSHYLDVITRL